MFKYILEADSNYDGVLDFHEFKSAIKYAQRKLKQNENSDWNSIYNLHNISKVTVRVKGFLFPYFYFWATFAELIYVVLVIRKRHPTENLN